MIIFFLLGFFCYRKDKTICTSIRQKLHIYNFLIEGIVGHTYNYVISLFICHLFNTTYYSGEEMMHDLGNYDTNGFRLPVFKTKRDVIGFIIIKFGKSLNFLPGIFTNFDTIPQSLGNGRN